MSHEFFLIVTEGMNTESSANQNALSIGDSTGVRGVETIILIVLLLLGMMMLVAGPKMMNVVITSQVYLLFFYLIYALADSLSYNSSSAFDYVMCLLPLTIALIASLVITILLVVLMKRIIWLSAFFLGATGTVVCFIVLRCVMLSGWQSLATAQSFQWYWLLVAIGAIVGGAVGTWCKEHVFAFACLSVGSFLLASTISAFVLVYSGSAIGILWFLVFIAASVVFGAASQIFIRGMISASKKPAEKVAETEHVKRTQQLPERPTEIAPTPPVSPQKLVATTQSPTASP